MKQRIYYSGGPFNGYSAPLSFDPRINVHIALVDSRFDFKVNTPAQPTRGIYELHSTVIEDNEQTHKMLWKAQP